MNEENKSSDQSSKEGKEIDLQKMVEEHEEKIREMKMQTLNHTKYLN